MVGARLMQMKFMACGDDFTASREQGAAVLMHITRARVRVYWWRTAKLRKGVAERLDFGKGLGRRAHPRRHFILPNLLIA